MKAILITLLLMMPLAAADIYLAKETESNYHYAIQHSDITIIYPSISDGYQETPAVSSLSHNRFLRAGTSFTHEGFARSFDFTITVENPGGFAYIEKGLHEGGYRLLGTDYVYLPVYECFLFNEQNEIFDTWFAHTSVNVEDSTLYMDVTGTLSSDAARVDCFDPLVDASAPVIGYVTSRADNNTMIEEFVDFLESNDERNFTVLPVNSRWSNLSSYDALVDLFWVGGTSVSLFNTVDLNQTTRGLILAARADLATHLGFCDIENNHISSAREVLYNSGPIFNATNGVTIGRMELYGSSKDFPGCSSAVNNPGGTAVWAFRDEPDSEYGGLALESGTTLTDHWTIQSRWVHLGFEDNHYATGPWLPITEDLAIDAINWVLEPHETNQTNQTDTTPPTVVIDFPIATTYTSVVTELMTTITDDVALDSCRYSDGGPLVAFPCGSVVTGLNAGEGTHTWIVRATDTSGNTASESVTFTVAVNTPPPSGSVTIRPGIVDVATWFSIGSVVGLTDSSSYWLCTDAACASSCQVDMRGGIIVGCN